MLDLPQPFLVAWWTALGLVVGSFLNVAIHRLPIEGESVGHPRRSRCPSCRRDLTWRENVPVLSWVLQRGRCVGCGWRIPLRYPLVEILTAALWLWLAATTLPSWGLLIVRTTVVSGLVVATFVDFDCFEIPDEVSIGGMVLAPLASLLVPLIHDDSWLAIEMSPEGAEHVTRSSALFACLVGMAVGGGLLWLVGWVGTRVYGRDAMGFGDVKLLAAGGGFLGPGGVLVALMIGSVVASFAGVGNILRFFCLIRGRARHRGRTSAFGRTVRVARVAGRYVPFGPYLAVGIGIVLVYWKDVVTWVSP